MGKTRLHRRTVFTAGLTCVLTSVNRGNWRRLTEHRGCGISIKRRFSKVFVDLSGNVPDGTCKGIFYLQHKPLNESRLFILKHFKSWVQIQEISWREKPQKSGYTPKGSQQGKEVRNGWKPDPKAVEIHTRKRLTNQGNTWNNNLD